MKFIFKAVAIITLLLAIMLLAGCFTALLREDDRYIIGAREALRLVGKDNVVLVYVQREPREIVRGAVIISREDIIIDLPVPGMLLPRNKFEELMGRSGISNDSLVIIYDSGNTNMDAARLWWTLRVYGHTNAKVVSGGLAALLEAGAETTTEAPVVTPTTFTAQPANHDLIATIGEVFAQVTRPVENVFLLDNRLRAEFDAGFIPRAVLVPHVDNLHNDGTFKSIEWIKLMYRGKGIRENNIIIVYCVTGLRSATTFLALFNAGFENVKLFDGSWLQWTAAALPVELPPVVEPGVPPVPAPAPG
ncbi:sulfurtransferase [Candidatus Acetothermia bacterium]|jgi:thiosulfate/3-mercaptopyruvate sulfurtransferase|nr:sulfurtransferase [Candidatus Acetothermia bacterium]MCI2427928.1 sulfurtransferase [Candidatus Acetothermia bacterium]MCI2427970.1 sulfurtransferase [Candidatus Acetothermia bacterium]